MSNNATVIMLDECGIFGGMSYASRVKSSGFGEAACDKLDIPLRVSFDEKGLAKEYGAKWDPARKAWIAKDILCAMHLKDYIKHPEDVAYIAQFEGKKWLMVSFNERDMAKEARARWHAECRAWYAPNASVAKELEPWLWEPRAQDDNE